MIDSRRGRTRVLPLLLLQKENATGFLCRFADFKIQIVLVEFPERIQRHRIAQLDQFVNRLEAHGSTFVPKPRDVISDKFAI